MKFIYVFLCVMVSLSVSISSSFAKGGGASSTQPKTSHYARGDGSSFKNAVVFPNVKSTAKGVPLEYRWVRDTYPGYRKQSQSLVSNEQRVYDVIEIVGPKGDVKQVFFDITDWFGKF